MNAASGAAGVVRDRWYEALDWHTRLQHSSETEWGQDRIRAWQEWLADDQNRLIFDQLSRLLEDGRQCRRRRVPGAAAADNDRCDPSVPLASGRPAAGRAMQGTVGHGSRLRPVKAAMAATVAMTLALLGSLPIFNPSRQTEALHTSRRLHQTGAGEVHSLALEDGSTVILGARSVLSVNFSPARRSVQLERGEAWFKVAHNRARPFVVGAGGRTITAVGTAFVVQRDSDRVVITVTDGSVEVAPPANDEHPSFRHPVLSRTRMAGAQVIRGQRMSYQDSGSAGTVEHADPRAATSWTEGRLEFDHEPLRYVAQVVNRYSRRTIILDQASGDQLYTGLVLRDQIDDWTHGLERIFPVEVSERGGELCVRARGARQVHGSSGC